MNRYERVLARMGGTRAFTWFGRRVLTPVDKRLRGHKTITTLGTHLPLCYLTTVGRKSGRQVTSPLLWIEAGDGAVAVAGSNWGTTHHPGWTYNLDAEPAATLEVDGRARAVIARRTAGDERDRLWEAFVAAWPPYAKYADRTTREIRLFVLEDV